ncbi:MAG: dTDP-4-dehydrorhamnose reductase [Proteobacteria bacterium]|nr:dTDP-4-dehydrorhamnose reductase [Pseudomonadota bacterium]
MRVLVVGAGGQVGTALKDLGISLGHHIIALDRSELDITDGASVTTSLEHHEPDTVINAAAYTAVDRAEAESALAFSINADGAENIAKACKQLDIPFLHISTDFVFDGTKLGAYVEEDSVGPLSVYGNSKAEGEKRIQNLGGKNIILRTAWVFGGEQNFVATMQRLGESRDELNIVNDQTGGPTSNLEIANCLLAIAEKVQEEGFSDWGIYHFAGAPSVTWYEFACAIFAGRDKPVLHPIPTEKYPTPAVRPKNSVLDCSKIKDVFDIDQPDWRKALSAIIS